MAAPGATFLACEGRRWRIFLDNFLNRLVGQASSVFGDFNHLKGSGLGLEGGGGFAPLRWIADFVEMGRRRLRALTRLLGWSILVGIVAGLGAIVFFSACQLVVHYTLDAWPGIKPMPPAASHRCSVRPISPFAPG